MRFWRVFGEIIGENYFLVGESERVNVHHLSERVLLFLLFNPNNVVYC